MKLLVFTLISSTLAALILGIMNLNGNNIETLAFITMLIFPVLFFISILKYLLKNNVDGSLSGLIAIITTIIYSEIIGYLFNFMGIYVTTLSQEFFSGLIM